MSDARKAHVLDTSVLIHSPDAYLRFEEHDVGIPITLIEELDDLKGRSDLVGFAARTASREIEALGHGARLPGGGKLILLSEYTEPRGLPGKLRDIADNRIVGAAYRLQQQVASIGSGRKRRGKEPYEHAARRVVFVSKDYNQRLKAKICGLVAEDYKTDKVVQTFSEIPSGVLTIRVADDVQGKQVAVYARGNKCVPADLVLSINPRVRFFPNACCLLYKEKEFLGAGIYKAPRNEIVIVEQYGNGNGGGNGDRVKPANAEQALAFALVNDPTIDLVTLVGPAGTGKTLMALLAAWGMIGIEQKESSSDGGRRGHFNSLVVYRPNIELGTGIGFLKGGLDEKYAPWKVPIYDNMALVLGPQQNGGDKAHVSVRQTIDHFVECEYLSIEPINFVRGRSINRAVVLIDEAQNLTAHEVKTIVTRAGRGTKVIMTGDLHQIDHPRLDFASSGLTRVINVFAGQENYGHIMLQKSLRSRLSAQGAQLL